MKTSEVLYRARDYIRDHGFSYSMFDGCATCIAGAVVTLGTGRATEIMNKHFLPALGLCWGDIGAQELERDGWTQGDAIAALEMAADIAFAEGQ